MLLHESTLLCSTLFYAILFYHGVALLAKSQFIGLPWLFQCLLANVGDKVGEQKKLVD